MRLNGSGETGTVISSCQARLLLSLLCLFLLGSCGDGLQGRVVLSGSSTLAPWATAAVATWTKAHPRVTVRVEGVGSNTGLERLIRFSDTDFALVSRPITVSEQVTAQTLGKTLVVVPVAWDAVGFVVPASNTWAHSFSRDQAARAFTSAALWSDLDPLWPPQAIHRFALGPSSGTSEVLADALLEGNKERIFQASAVQSSEEAQIVARGVRTVNGAVGYLGWTTFLASDPGLKFLGLDGVNPSPTTIRDHTYGLTRQLWLVTTRQALGSGSPDLSLLALIVDQAPSLATDAGLIPLSDQEQAQVRIKLESFLNR